MKKILKQKIIELIELFDEVDDYDELNDNELKELATNIIEEFTIPERYLEGLKGDNRLLRQVELIKKRRQEPEERYEELYSDKYVRQLKKEGKYEKKKSGCIDKWQKKYKTTATIENIHNKTGIPIKILNKVDNKGRGAFYSSGSRPGQNAYSWGLARVACFALNKPTVTEGPDRHLYEEAMNTEEGKEWFNKTKWSN